MIVYQTVSLGVSITLDDTSKSQFHKDSINMGVREEMSAFLKHVLVD
jgi:hypothetical protein